MNPPSFRIHQRGQRIDICRLQLRELAEVEDLARDLMLDGQLFQNVNGSRDRLSLAILHGLGQAKLVEEDVPELLRRVYVELGASNGVNLARTRIALLLKLDGHPAQGCDVDLYAR